MKKRKRKKKITKNWRLLREYWEKFNSTDKRRMKKWQVARCVGSNSCLMCFCGCRTGTRVSQASTHDVTTKTSSRTGPILSLSSELPWNSYVRSRQSIVHIWRLECGMSLLPPTSFPLPLSSPPPHKTHTQPEIEWLFLIHCYLVHMHNSCLILVVIFRKYCLSLSVK